MRRWTTVVLALAPAALAPACGPAESGEAEPAEIEWGLGAKADGVCDPRGDLCWPTDDLRAVRTVERMAIEAGLGERPAPAALEEAVAQAEALAHKLTDEELVRLGAIADEAYAGGLHEARALALLAELRDETLARARGAYLAATVVPTGRAAEAQRDGKVDDAHTEPVDVGAGDGYTEGMRESLRMLRDAGLGGSLYAAMMEMSGALDADYDVLDRDAMASLEGPSRRARVRDSIGRHRLVAGGVGTGTGLVSLIPIAGIPLSIPLEAAGIMAVHTRMALEISSLHGWDIREGANLYIVTMFLLSDDALDEVGGELAAAPSLPAVIRRLAADLGIPISTTMSVRLAGTITSYAASFLLRKARDAIVGEAAEQVVEGAAHQILGWATLGLSALVSGAVDYVVTDRLGRHVELVSRPWVVDLPVEGLAYLREPDARRCFASSLAAVLRADGQVEDREARYFAAFLEKPYYDGQGAWYELSRQERRELALALGPGADPDAGCLGRFKREEPIDKLAILSHLYAGAGVTGSFSPAALRVYRGAADTLDGSGWFDGPAVEPHEIDYVERAAEIALDPGSSSWPPTYRDAVSELSIDDILTYLRNPGRDVMQDVECGLAGGC
jgi:hypothetical protein